jgi:TDG/mug DNA glycosylase family protein
LRLLHAAGFTPSLLAPTEQELLLDFGYGLTNAARRTTRGSSELRRADFDGAAERLAAIADELRPRVIAFVGKAAYEGPYRERPELGLQERRLADTLLYVLPSTSPANAAVPWEERLRWFRDLRDLLSRTSGS